MIRPKRESRKETGDASSYKVFDGENAFIVLATSNHIDIDCGRAWLIFDFAHLNVSILRWSRLIPSRACVLCLCSMSERNTKYLLYAHTHTHLLPSPMQTNVRWMCLCADLRSIYAINNFELLFLLNHRTDTCFSFIFIGCVPRSASQSFRIECASPIKCHVCRVKRWPFSFAACPCIQLQLTVDMVAWHSTM